MNSAPSLTDSQREQFLVQNQVFQIYNLASSSPHASPNLTFELQRDNHMDYLVKGLKKLGPSFSALDANRPWLCYWIFHSIALLGESVDEELENNAIDFLSHCQDPDGGYGGGPGQMPHLATTYAAVNTLVTIGSDESFSSINRNKIYDFLHRMKDASGAFRMHDAGEIDVRACYTAISVASLLNILDDELVRNVADYIVSCQTYEGGIGGEPGSEAHGGYTFCGLATMILIDEVNRLDLASLTDWLVHRQGVEFGFQGRSNKLVDGCYSFWQGGAGALLQRLKLVDEKDLGLDIRGDTPGESSDSASLDISSSEEEGTQDDTCSGRSHGVAYNSNKSRTETRPLFDSLALQRYILLCSQEVYGGFKDKPMKYRDYYHTCYCLSGLSVCQYSWSNGDHRPPLPQAVLGPYSNLLEPIHPLYNVVLDRSIEAQDFFSGRIQIHQL